MWLDFKLFGNGFGLKSPFWDDRFYWLVDTYNKDRNEKNGNFYNWIGGYGAQLASSEWRMIPAGTVRILAGRQFRVFQCSRKWLKCRASWALAQSNTPTMDEILKLKSDLERDL